MRTGGVRPADDRPAAVFTVSERYRIREMRRASRELDQLLGIERTDHTEPDWSQYALTWDERRAAA